MNKRQVSYSLVSLTFAISALVGCNQSSPKPESTNSSIVAEEGNNKKNLNRNPSNIHYSKHAKCRMTCRHIDETEVKDILQNGTINYKKSNLNGDDCHKKYAVEGTSKDNQKLRIIFAPCNTEVTVVTCIDIGEEWQCHCEGDKN